MVQGHRRIEEIRRWLVDTPKDTPIDNSIDTPMDTPMDTPIDTTETETETETKKERGGCAPTDFVLSGMLSG